MENNLIYALYCPTTNKPVYVGQSSVGINRPFAHIKEKSHSKKVNDWISYLKLNNKEPILVILENTFDLKYLNDKEQYWINKLLLDGNLLLNQQNVTPAFYTTTQFDTIAIKNDDLFEIRMFIKGRRKILKLNQIELSKKSGIGLRFIREIEQGYKDNFSTKTLFKLLRFLGNVKIKLIPSDIITQ